MKTKHNLTLALALSLAGLSAHAAEKYFMRVPAPAKCAGASCAMNTIAPGVQAPVTPPPPPPVPQATLTAVTTSNFGTVQINDVKSSLTFTFQSPDAVSDMYASVAGSDLTVSTNPSLTTCGIASRHASLPAGGATCNITVSFGPKSLGAMSGTLMVTSPSKQLASIQLSGKGGTAVPVLTTNAVAGVVSFGTIPVGSTASKTFTLANTGDADLKLGSYMFLGPNPAFATWVLSTTCPGTVVPGASCTFTTKVTPVAKGYTSTTLFVGTNNGAPMVQVDVTGG